MNNFLEYLGAVPSSSPFVAVPLVDWKLSYTCEILFANENRGLRLPLYMQLRD